MNDSAFDRCCTPEDAWAIVQVQAEGALKDDGSVLADFVDHALGAGPCPILKMTEALERFSAIMSKPSLRRELTHGRTEAGLLRWAENMASLALDEARPDAAAELAEILDDWLRLLQEWETAPLQREVRPHFSRGRSTTLSCQDCGPVAPRLSWKGMVDGRVHLGAHCPGCDRWIKWLPQTDEWLSAAPPLRPAWRRSV